MPMPVAAPPPAVAPQGAAPPPPPPAGEPTSPPRRPRTWPDRPIRWRVDIAGEMGTTVIADPAWRAFDVGNRQPLHFGASMRGDFRLGDGRVFFGGGASFRRFASFGGIYDATDESIVGRDLLAFLRLSVVTVEGLDVFFQAGGGPSFATLDLSSSAYYTDDNFSGSSYAYQRAVMGMVDGQAGLALYLPKKWLPRRGASRVTAGLELAAGYTFRNKLHVRPELSTDSDPIPTHTSSFGDVAIRGFMWRFGLFIRFQ
jgi:hypothetical protein